MDSLLLATTTVVGFSIIDDEPGSGSLQSSHVLASEAEETGVAASGRSRGYTVIQQNYGVSHFGL